MNIPSIINFTTKVRLRILTVQTAGKIVSIAGNVL